MYWCQLLSRARDNSSIELELDVLVSTPKWLILTCTDRYRNSYKCCGYVGVVIYVCICVQVYIFISRLLARPRSNEHTWMLRSDLASRCPPWQKEPELLREIADPISGLGRVQFFFFLTRKCKMVPRIIRTKRVRASLKGATTGQI